jgi:hypothetical protein
VYCSPSTGLAHYTKEEEEEEAGKELLAFLDPYKEFFEMLEEKQKATDLYYLITEKFLWSLPVKLPCVPPRARTTTLWVSSRAR